MSSPGGHAGVGGSLPAAARARLDRLRAGEVPRTSYLSVASAAALRSVGFGPVGDVMGCATSQIGYAFVPTCTTLTDATTGTTVRTGARTPGGGTGYLGLIRGLYARALRRLLDEAVAMGADGVVGISLTSTERDEVTEVVALGTGVRADTAVRAGTRPPVERPFTTDLPATDVAKLLGDGWVPVSLHVATQLGVRHLDQTSARLMRAASSRWTNSVVWSGANAEVDGPSEVIQQVKAATRAVLGAQVAAAGADGCLLSSLEVTVREKECSRITGSPGDLVGLGLAVGTSVARLRGGRPRTGPALTFLPLAPNPPSTTRPPSAQGKPR